MKNIVLNLHVIVKSGALLSGAVLVALAVRFLFVRTIKAAAMRSRGILMKSVVKHLSTPLYLLLPLVAVSFSLEFTALSPHVTDLIRKVISVAFVISVAWLLAKLSFVLEDLILSRYKMDVSDNLKARKIYTQVQFFKRGVIIVICIIALAIMLMSFERVRQLGTAILASAGVLGIIIGFAAQRSLSTLLAGLQIAITQPFRIDDVVIVEGEWGRIEEITLTYVVVRIWDLRRLVLPITYFLEKPFQNWTRESANLLATVYLYTDYRVPVEKVRSKLQRILQDSDLWDGKVWNLQVTNANEKSVELRALMSAEDASTAWNLRCEVREKLLDFIQSKYPDALPRLRAEFHNGEDTS
jgi:small-conductance mechanosensitive channel